MGQGLLGIADLSPGEILSILDLAAEFKSRAGQGMSALPSLTGKLIGNLFFEPSTRTRCSFEVAAKRLGAEIVNWTVAGTSAEKGETTVDSVKTLAAMGLDALVVRHPAAGEPLRLSAHVTCPVINAGDGAHEHPSQALIDAFTLREALGDLTGRTLAIVGDLSHSRVARSNLFCLPRLGMRLILCGPPALLPETLLELAPRGTVRLTHSLREAVTQVDAVMALRVQKERFGATLYPSDADYARLYGLQAAASAGWLAEQVLLLHPGPFNPGVEISAELAESPRSLILRQVTNGVFVRMAILTRAVQA